MLEFSVKKILWESENYSQYEFLDNPKQKSKGLFKIFFFLLYQKNLHYKSIYDIIAFDV